ncbi:methyltransferase domain-containing protein [Granulicella sp. WH15]|uniref:methyltransferase domain-containing protein n=1 Tax=Granulicella sp. WH15 TaxID=2602070 RepID=UPI0013A5835B|nr:methyltransferase domain-containing protein [Granulicella sp. WH15]
MSHPVHPEHVLTQLLENEKAITCGEQSRHTYFDTHQARFADILRLCRGQVPIPSARVLDIGRSELTAYLLNFYPNIHTLGFDPAIDDGGHRETSDLKSVPHIPFDLLNAHVVSSWPDCGRFDLIVFSEVLEHLCVAPEFVFALLSSLLTDQGVLICTTPNATDISKRLRLLLGRNPYERLRLYSINPGHIREYTRQELSDIAQSVGLSCIGHHYFNWIQGSNQSRIKTIAKKLLRAYPSFRSFQLCVLTRATPSRP